MKPAVEQAITDIERSLVGSRVRVHEDPDGGAFVIVDNVGIGPSFEPTTTWAGFHVTWSYPDADVYPHFIDAVVKYVGTGPAPNQHADGDLPTPMSRGAVMPGFDLPAIQVSRRSNRRNVATDTALQKLLRVLAFVRSR